MNRSAQLRGSRRWTLVHCQECGAATVQVNIDGLPRNKCPSCAWIFWNNPIPAVGLVARRGNEVLLCLRGREPKIGLWDFPGGIMEVGETAEAALHREIMEELGCKISGVQLLGTWPGDYGGRSTLNLLYQGELLGEPSANDDVAEIRWWPLNKLPELAWDHEADCLSKLSK